ncbi:hypothetical protein, partial [Streptomyces sp. NPDC058694]|uniref:hypothetical protein n=1 Tax=Streptomyces sp. NPDC058694 TaxID=3346603 RepID=UPI00365B2527
RDLNTVTPLQFSGYSSRSLRGTPGLQPRGNDILVVAESGAAVSLAISTVGRSTVVSGGAGEVPQMACSLDGVSRGERPVEGRTDVYVR